MEQDPKSTVVRHGTEATARGEHGKEVNDLSYNFAEQEKHYGKQRALLCPVRQSGRGERGLELQDMEAIVERQTLYMDQDKI